MSRERKKGKRKKNKEEKKTPYWAFSEDPGRSRE